MKRVFFITIAAAAAIIMGYGIKLAVTPVASQTVELAVYEHKTAAQGFIIREEAPCYAQNSGKLYKNVSVGARIPKDTQVYTIFDESVSDDSIKELNTLDKKIADAQEESEAEAYGTTAVSVESEIAARAELVIEAAAENDVSKIAGYKRDINSLRSNGAVESSGDRLENLQSQKQELQSGMGGAKEEGYAQISGVFTMYYDGFAELLDKDKVKEYSVEYLEGLAAPETVEAAGTEVEAGGFIGSVVNNHKWSVIAVTDTDEISKYEAGDSVMLRFKNIADSEQKGTIKYISSKEQNKDGKSFVLIECSDYFEGAFSYREAELEIVFESYSGYKVPSSAIRTSEADNTHKVIGVSGGKECECDINVLYSDSKEGYSIVESTENAANKISSMDRIVVGER